MKYLKINFIILIFVILMLFCCGCISDQQIKSHMSSQGYSVKDIATGEGIFENHASMYIDVRSLNGEGDLWIAAIKGIQALYEKYPNYDYYNVIFEYPSSDEYRRVFWGPEDTYLRHEYSNSESSRISVVKITNILEYDDFSKVNSFYSKLGRVPDWAFLG